MGAACTTTVEPEGRLGLGSEVTFGLLPVFNRVVMGPIARAAVNAAGNPSDRLANYFARRAQGGAGLIIVGGIPVNSGAVDDAMHYAGLATAAQRDKWHRILQYIKVASPSRLAAQLMHMGPFSTGGLAASKKSTTLLQRTLSSPLCPATESRAATGDELKSIVADYVTTARSAVDAGFDMIEICASQGYLLDSFLETTNDRPASEPYGGQGWAERLAFPLEVVQAVKKAVGTEVPVIVQLSQWSQGDYDIHSEHNRRFKTLEEFKGLLYALWDAGADAFHLAELDIEAPFTGRTEGTEGITAEMPLCECAIRLLAARQKQPRPVVMAGGGICVSPPYSGEDLTTTANNSITTAPLQPTHNAEDRATGPLAPGVRNPSRAIKLVADGKCDMLVLGRSIISNFEIGRILISGKDFDQIKPYNPADMKKLTF